MKSFERTGKSGAPDYGSPPVLADLFSGCGGFSLGARQAGFDVSIAFDNDPILASSYSYNFPTTRLIPTDISKLTGEELLAASGGRIDGVFGGPPCQGFSDIGRRQASDPRRQLIWHFFRIVSEVAPLFFVVENVRGLAYADARGVLDGALELVQDRYSLLGPVILDASQFGAATKRPRLFVVGVNKDGAEELTDEDIAVGMRNPATVRSALADLQGAVSLGERDGFDLWKIARRGRPHDYARAIRAPDGTFTGHRSTVHTPPVVERFAKVLPGDVDAVGRHPRLTWTGQCPTLRAGTGADRGSYQAVRPIHPDENRVITVREAARLQGFPDAHRFHPTVWHSFRMIGNSVSPFVARAIFGAVKRRLGLEPAMPIAAE